MDICSYFGSTSQASSDAKADSDSEDHGTDTVALIPSHLLALHLQRKYARVARIKDTTVLFCIHEEKILEELGEGFQLAVL